MKKLLFSLFALTLLLTSCGPDPIKYNDTLVDILEKANADYESIDGMFSDLIDAEKYGELGTVSKTPIDSLNARIETIKNLELPSGAENFRDAVIKYVESLIGAAKAYDGFAIMEKDDVSTDEIQAVTDNLEKMQEEFDKTFVIVTETQKEFAKKKGFTLDKK